jgi:hypothetical protein
MRAVVLSVLALLMVSGVATRAGQPVAGDQQVVTSGQDLLDKLSSDSECDNDSALGYIMGVYGAHTKQGALPDTPTQKKIAEIVKKTLEADKDRLNGPANKLLVEIFDKEKSKLRALTSQSK